MDLSKEEITPDILRCLWCGRDTKSAPCEHCGSDQVCDRTKPHSPHWSRKSIQTVECKICGREIPYHEHGKAGDICLPGLVRRDVLKRTLAALEDAAADAMSYGPSEADSDYLAAIAEAKAELQEPNK